MKRKYVGYILVMICIIGNSNVALAASSKYKYNASKACDYALSHATKRNTKEFPDYKSNDCTNFASQCIAYGGVKMLIPSSVKYGSKDDVHNERTNFYALKNRAGKWAISKTWTAVDMDLKGLARSKGFYERIKEVVDSSNAVYNISGPKGKVYTNMSYTKLMSYVRLGDVVQFQDGKSVGCRKHTIVCSSIYVKSNGTQEKRFSSHGSPDYVNMDLKKIHQKNKESNVYKKGIYYTLFSISAK